MVFRPLLALASALSLLATQVSGQTTAVLDFYYDIVAEFDCSYIGLPQATATVGSCVDISTISFPLLDKHWQAFSGDSVPTGCSGKLYIFERCTQRNFC
jgi:hypothetical protein